MTTDPAAGAALRGAVDLGALAAAREAQERAEARRADGPTALSIDVTEATFQAEVIEQSFVVPVVLDLWATWCEPCKALSPILEKLATEYDGAFVLAKIDVDANPRISQAFQVQSIPSVIAVVGGQPVPLFQGALPEPSVRQVLDELLRVAKEGGVGSATGEESEDDALQVDEDERLVNAEAALTAGDYPTAIAAFEDILTTEPDNVAATTGKAYAGILSRASAVADPEAVRSADPDDVSASCAGADLMFATGDIDGAFDRLIATVAATEGDDRATAREHLLGLFAALTDDDPRLHKARTALANALF